MDNSYEELKAITDKYYETEAMPAVEVFINLLAKYGIKLRQNDGIFDHVTFSVPKSRKNALVLGLRYLKKENIWTEDHFLFEKGKKIKAYYKGKMEKTLHEYKDTHKKQRGFY